VKVKIKLKTTRFIPAYVSSLPKDKQASAQVDMGPEFSRALSTGLERTCGKSRGKAIYTVVVDFHDDLIKHTLLKENPFLAAS
jgi:hypothetical protein